jgi:hypothetical protein
MGSILNSLNRFLKYLGRGRQRPRSRKFPCRLRIEEFEGRIVPSTLNISAGNQALFVGNSTLLVETLTMSETTVGSFFGPIAERTFTDPSDTINVTGPGASACRGSGTHTVTWFASLGVGSIEALMKASSTFVNLQSMDCGTYITQNQGEFLTVNLGNTSNGVQSILGAVGVDQGPGDTCNVTVDDSADTGSHPNVTFNGGFLQNLAPAPIHVGQNFSGGLFLLIKGGQGTNNFTLTNTTFDANPEFSSVTLFPGSARSSVNVQATSAPLNIDNNGGGCVVTIGSFAPGYGGTLANINSGVFVGGTGSTYLFIDDSGDPDSHYVDLTGTSLVGLRNAPIQWTPSAAAAGGVTNLTILGSAGGSIYNVINTPNLSGITQLITGAGPDQVVVNATTSPLNLFNSGGQDYVYVGNGTLAGINGNVTVYGAGPTSLYIEDHSDTTSHTATLTSKELSGLAKGSVFWFATNAFPYGISYLEIDGSAAASTYSVTNTPAAPTYFDLGASGTDVVVVGGTTGSLYVLNGTGAHAEVVVATASAGSINGLVDVYGAGDTYLYVEDYDPSAPRTATLTATSLTGLFTGAIEWTPSLSPSGGVTFLEVYSTGANTTFNVTSIPSLCFGTSLVGGTGTNTLIGPSTTNTWNITGADEGNLNVSSVSPLQFSGIQNLVGSTGVDTFAFTAAASLVASIDGGGAPVGQGDWLDYTAFPSGVSVNLATGKATGVSGTLRNIQNVFGGNHGNTLTGDSQGNILIGGAGADQIFGGIGASLLIGGGANDTVTGGSGGDILIGGSTTFDQAHNEAALMSILAEWQSSKPYATRVHDLKVGGGLNGSNTLVLGTTVLDDGGADSLTGGSHIPGALDWFFQGSHDKIHHLESGEQIN